MQSNLRFERMVHKSWKYEWFTNFCWYLNITTVNLAVLYFNINIINIDM